MRQDYVVPESAANRQIGDNRYSQVHDEFSFHNEEFIPRSTVSNFGQPAATKPGTARCELLM
jgi:hypothetical protein